jgi:hypothetical protein
MRFLHSLTTRLVLSHLLVATLSGITVSLVVTLLVALVIQNLRPADYRGLAERVAAPWLFGETDDQLKAQSDLVHPQTR